MSSKSSKPAKKLSVPREMKDIQTEYQTLCFNAGQAQYQVKIHQRELDKINERLEAVNNEAAARLQLDKDAKKDQPQTEAANG